MISAYSQPKTFTMTNHAGHICMVADIRENMRLSIQKHGILNFTQSVWRTAWRTDVLAATVEIESNVKINNSLTLRRY